MDNQVVRAKFRVGSIAPWWNDVATIVRLHPVTEGSPENKQFFESTPSGYIELVIKNDVAARQFELNKEYYIDFVPAHLVE